MPNAPKKKWRHRYTQVAVYMPPLLLEKLKSEALQRRRKLGPTALEILHQYFEKKERDYPKFADT